MSIYAMGFFGSLLDEVKDFWQECKEDFMPLTNRARCANVYSGVKNSFNRLCHLPPTLYRGTALPLWLPPEHLPKPSSKILSDLLTVPKDRDVYLLPFHIGCYRDVVEKIIDKSIDGCLRRLPTTNSISYACSWASISWVEIGSTFELSLVAKCKCAMGKLYRDLLTTRGYVYRFPNKEKIVRNSDLQEDWGAAGYYSGLERRLDPYDTSEGRVLRQGTPCRVSNGDKLDIARYVTLSQQHVNAQECFRRIMDFVAISCANAQNCMLNTNSQTTETQPFCFQLVDFIKSLYQPNQ